MHSLSNSYPVWFVDIWGVVHNGVTPYASTVTTLIKHRQNGGTVVLVSNSPRSTIGVTKQLDDIGITRDAYDTAVTSGDVTRDLMRQVPGGKLYHLGPARDVSIFEGLPITRVELEEASAVICTGLFHDTRETPADYREQLAAMRARDLTMICANPDKIVRVGGRLQYCAGSLAEAYAALGGKVEMAGKPYAPIYDLAKRHAATLRDQPITTDMILAIGDGPDTDIRGAADQGLACVFVTGLHDGDVKEADTMIRKHVADAKVLRTVETLEWDIST